MVEHKLASFLTQTVVAFWTLVTLEKMMPFWLLCCEREPNKTAPAQAGVFIPVTEISVAKTEISVTEPARLVI